MPTSPGDHFGPYEILSLLGEGMGQVWKARDTRLDCIVAIKTPLHHFNKRFDREARAVATLDHPNVCTLHDIGPDYLVMEFVDGPTLADRMSRGAMSVEDTLPIARQIAAAMEAAHEKGVIHRDLKPENVKFTSDGTVKVLDFGLAKATGIAEDPGSAPTVKAGVSLPGLIVGTPAYMSPEQASGNPIDKRTDIWAFGVLLWEMVTGRRMFEGQRVPQVLAAVLKEEPDIQAAPLSLRPLLMRCLIKDPKKRMRDIGEARLMLDGDFPASVLPALPQPARYRRPSSLNS